MNLQGCRDGHFVLALLALVGVAPSGSVQGITWNCEHCCPYVVLRLKSPLRRPCSCVPFAIVAAMGSAPSIRGPCPRKQREATATATRREVTAWTTTCEASMSACRHEASAFAYATRGSYTSFMNCMFASGHGSDTVPPPRRVPSSTPLSWGQLPELMQGCLVSVGMDELRFLEVAATDWSREWHGWREVRSCMNEANVMAWKQRFLRVAAQNANIGCRDNVTCLLQLERAGFRLVAADGDGNNCLISALMLSMASQGVLPKDLLACRSTRLSACAAFRENFVWSEVDALRPRQRSDLGQPLSVSEAEHAKAFLQAETHGPAAVQFLLHHFDRAQALRSTTFMIVVYTRFDCANLNPLNMAILVGERVEGHPTVMLRLYNQMDARGQGYRFDALVEDATARNGQGSAPAVHRALPEVAMRVDDPNWTAPPAHAELRAALGAFLRARGADELGVAASDVERVAAAWNRREDLAGILLVFSVLTRVCARRLAAEFLGFVATYCAGPGRKLGSGCILCAESKNSVSNFLSVRRVRPADATNEANSDDAASDPDVDLVASDVAEIFAKSATGAGGTRETASAQALRVCALDSVCSQVEATWGSAAAGHDQIVLSRKEPVVMSGDMKTAAADARASQRKAVSERTALGGVGCIPDQPATILQTAGDVEQAVRSWLQDVRARCNTEQFAFLERVAARVLREEHDVSLYGDDDRAQASDDSLRWVLHGGPGTGKSYVLKLLKEELFESVLGWQRGVQFEVVALQATNADALDGDATHHALSTPFSPPTRKTAGKRWKILRSEHYFGAGCFWTSSAWSARSCLRGWN